MGVWDVKHYCDNPECGSTDGKGYHAYISDTSGKKNGLENQYL